MLIKTVNVPDNVKRTVFCKLLEDTQQLFIFYFFKKGEDVFVCVTVMLYLLMLAGGEIRDGLFKCV